MYIYIYIYILSDNKFVYVTILPSLQDFEEKYAQNDHSSMCLGYTHTTFYVTTAKIQC